MAKFNDPYSLGSVNRSSNLKNASKKPGGVKDYLKKEQSKKPTTSRTGIDPYSNYTVNRPSNLKNAADKGKLQEYLNKEKKDHPEFAQVAKTGGADPKKDEKTDGSGAAGTGGSGESATPLLSDEELKKLLGIMPDEAEKKLDKFEKAGGHAIKSAYYGYDKNVNNPDGRTSRAYRSQLNTLIEKYATPHDLYGIGGMPAIFLDNTDPPGKPNSNVVGRQYLINNILNGTYVSFKPGYIEWAFTDEDATKLEGGEKPMGVIGKMFTGTLAHNKPQVDQYYRDVSRACRILAYQMGLDDVAFPFTLNSAGDVQKGGWFAKRGNQGGYKSVKGNFLFTSTSGNTKHMMTAETYRSIGQSLAAIVVNRQETPGIGVEKGDAGFIAFRISGNIEFTDTISNNPAENPIKELADSLFGTTDDLIKYFAGRFGVNPAKEGQGAAAFLVGEPMLPQVWSSSSYDKAYSFDVVLSTPYGNHLSVFMNIMYPIIKMAMLALPLGIGGFQTSPCICRVFSAGAINTEYGLITSLAIEKNMKTLNDAGLPTEVTMHVNLQDLNAYIYKEKAGWFNASVTLSTGFSIFLGTLAGVNFSTISIKSRAAISKALTKVEAAEHTQSMGTRLNYWFKDFVAGLMTPFVNAKESIGLKYAKWSGAAAGIVQGGVTKGAGNEITSDLAVDNTTGALTGKGNGQGATNKYRSAVKQTGKAKKKKRK